MSHTVYISYSSNDREVAVAICSAIEQAGIRCWIAPRDIAPGTEWGASILDAISRSSVLVVLLSNHSNTSPQVKREVERAASADIAILPLRIEDVQPSPTFEYFIAAFQWIDAFNRPLDSVSQKLVEAIHTILPDSEVGKCVPIQADTSRPESKGYVFLSYVRRDLDFVSKLRGVLREKDYGYWDYLDGDRDYHGALYRELEERIENSVAFITIVSDEWRSSDWIASEFIYAKEDGKPIFVIQAKKLDRPLPILLNLQTRIDMSKDFTSAADVLYRELEKKGL